MIPVNKKKKAKNTPSGSRSKRICPAVFILLSFLLMILPLEGFVASVKAVLSYIFIPQIRLSHATVEYAGEVNKTVRELLDAHHENRQLKQEMEAVKLLDTQAQAVFEENTRLTEAMKLNPARRWRGVWAKIAYREPTQWNTVILDKGTADGIEPRSAVISVEDGAEGLAGVVVEVTEKTAKVLLVRDEDFSAAVYLERGKEEGLLTGVGMRPVKLKYIPLLSSVQPGDKVFTAASSSIFPEGILVGTVTTVGHDDSFQTALSVEVTPVVRAGAVREVFVITDNRRKY